LGILDCIFKRNNKSSEDYNDIESLNFMDIDSVLEIVIQLNKDIWKDTSKWKNNNLKMEQYLTRLLLSSPNNTRALTSLGATLSDSGKHKEALAELLKAEKLKSKDANLYLNIGIAKMNIESERPNAKEYFDKASRLESDKLTFEAYFDPHGH